MRIGGRSRLQVLLKSVGVFPQVVPEAGDPRPGTSLEAIAACGSPFRDTLKVLKEVMPFLCWPAGKRVRVALAA